MRIHLLSIVCMILCVGCGKFGRLHGSTELRIGSASSNPLLAASPYNGDFVFYILGVNGTPYVATATARSLADAGNLSVTVPNGQYKVFSMAWEGGAGPYPLEGNTACGYGDGGAVYTLTGTAQTVNLSMAVANCNHGTNSIFSDGSYSTAASGFKTLTVHLCNGLTGSVCTSATNGLNGDFLEFTLDGYTENSGVRTYSSSAGLNRFGCAPIGIGSGSPGTAVSTAKTVPVGSSAGYPDMISVTLAVHGSADTTCTGPRLATYSFPYGLIKGLNGVSGTTAISAGSTTTDLYINAGP